MPLLQVTMIEGRSEGDKKKMMTELTDAVVNTLGVQPSSVRVIVVEVPATNWAVAGVPLSPNPQ